MQGVCLRHLTRVQFGPLRNFMSYIQVRKFLTEPHAIKSEFQFAGSSSREAQENLYRSYCLVCQPSLCHSETFYKN